MKKIIVLVSISSITRNKYKKPLNTLVCHLFIVWQTGHNEEIQISVTYESWSE